MHVMLSLAATDAGRSGLSTYVRCLYRAILSESLVARVTVLAADGEAEATGLPLDDPRLRLVHVPAALTGRTASVAWHLVGLPALARRIGADVVHLPVGNRRPGHAGEVPVVATVHDLGDQVGERAYGLARALYARHVVPRALAGADRIIAISRTTAEALARFAPPTKERTVVVPNGVDLERFLPGDVEAARRAVAAETGLTGPYVLYPARLEHPAKNHVRLIRAFLAARRRGALSHRLALAGAEWPGAAPILEAVAESGDAVRYLGFVDDAVLPSLVRGADLVVFPSLFEGFGLPPLEAMASGVPVVASNASSIPEVVGDAALLVDARDEAALTDAIVRATSEAPLRSRLRDAGLARAAGFGWRVCAHRTVAVFRGDSGVDRQWRKRT